MSWQRVMKERKENQRKRETPSSLLGRVLRRTTHIRSWYAFNGFKWTDIDPFYLDWLFADEEREAVLSSPYFINKRFNQYIDYNTAGQQSVKIYIEGWAGVGKTTLAQEVAHRILDRGNGGTLHHVFGLEPFARIFEEDIIQQGDVALADDIRYLEGEGSVKIVNRIANLANNLRFEEHHMIFVSSQALHAAKINPFCKLMMGGKLHSTQETVALVYLGDKLRGKIKLKVRDPAGFEAQVLEAKKESMRIIKLSGGKATVDLDGVIPYEEIYNFEPSTFRKFLIENTKGRIHKIFKAWFNGATQDEIASELGLSDQYKVSRIVTTFSQRHLGRIAEVYFREKFKDSRKIIGRAPQNVEDVVGDPDLVGILSGVASIKCYLGKRKNVQIDIAEECDPEINAVSKLEEPIFRLIFVNPLWNLGKEEVYQYIDIDLRNRPNSVTFHRDGKIKATHLKLA